MAESGWPGHQAPYDPALSPPLRGRESMVSLSSEYGDNNRNNHQQSYQAQGYGLGYQTQDYGYQSQVQGSAGYNSNGQDGYQSQDFQSHPQSYSAPPQTFTQTAPQRTPSTLARLGGFANRLSLRPLSHQALPQGDDIDLALMHTSAPMGGQEAHDHSPPSRDELFLKASQEQEAKGTLTGGLGVGFNKVDATMRERELIKGQTDVPQPPNHHHWTSSLSRTFSRARPMTRRDTIRGLGQHEANRRGQVIEVVVEEDESNAINPQLTTMDVTFMTGPATLNNAPRKRTRTEVFYPKGNWKPFAMRAPYLVMLIVLSLILALAQEMLYQRFHEKPMFKFRNPSELGSANYFAVKFLPTMVSVAYGVLWQVTDFEVMRLEAFYQLSKKGGALAGQSINVGYVTSWSLMRPIRAMKLGHYAVAVSSVATAMAVSLVPTFSAAALFLSPDRAMRMAQPNMIKSIHVRAAWSRLLTITLLLCAVFAIVLLFQLQSRKSGLLGDVRGIAGLASMAVASHILNDFRDLDTAKPKDIHNRLKHHRYVLRNASLAPDDEDPPSKQDQARFRPHQSENPHPVMLRPLGCVPFIIGLALFTGFVPIFLFTPATVITDKAPFLITALAVCIKLSWGAMESTVRLMEPYYILSRRHASPRTLTLDYAAMPFGYLAIQAFYNGHMLMFFVGFGSVMAEFLTILLTSLSTVDGRDFLRPVFGIDTSSSKGSDGINSGQETAVSFLVALALVIFILVYMFIMTTVIFARRRHAFLPRQPTTIASVLAFIHQSKMLWDFVDTARLSNADMTKHLSGKRKTYGLGWYRGRDGLMHCGIDEEELLMAYRHGVDYSEGNMPWVGQQ